MNCINEYQNAEQNNEYVDIKKALLVMNCIYFKND